MLAEQGNPGSRVCEVGTLINREQRSMGWLAGSAGSGRPGLQGRGYAFAQDHGRRAPALPVPYVKLTGFAR